MALTFASSSYLTHTYGSAPGLSLTIMIWCKGLGGSGSTFLCSSSDLAADTSVLQLFEATSTNKLTVQHRTPGSSRVADTVETSSAAAWVPAMGHGQTASPGTRVVAGTGATTGSEASTRTAQSHTTLRVAADGSPTAANFYPGDLGELVVWTGLTETEAQTAFAAIVAGGLPEDQFTANIYDVWDLETYDAGGTYTGLVNSHVLTAVGAGVSQAGDHPIDTSGRGGGGSSIAPISLNYNRLRRA